MAWAFDPADCGFEPSAVALVAIAKLPTMMRARAIPIMFLHMDSPPSRSRASHSPATCAIAALMLGGSIVPRRGYAVAEHSFVRCALLALAFTWLGKCSPSPGQDVLAAHSEGCFWLKQAGRRKGRPLIAAKGSCSPLHLAEEWLSMTLCRWSSGQNSPC